ncbi:TPA: 30S ribosomal protein S13 [Candidatus Uhrbacteria bacterium]|uniref:Small ribosomal subunit protein uS13 n=2 Tax=Candidatus Uhriibacteriota TaxID=1752732 RepID=A0A0G1T6M1_9BACT|nr:MAG: 30S ribosomal protein S13 [Candidatus Uhrbacteria bacterium GW2011_GWF2_46_218]KKU41025.1 MAG: 30S ribosomal protein S13 [Candidatus Uhrbacteria bacterium GW2011_GWE2_46_68]HBK33709.1 30S ribosomal protein S13 [Candidatus Uhrbacteria bacterium]HCB19050.1 30S ribosomal protein S13 [Candidatus Uhrbacteria bacterium]
MARIAGVTLPTNKSIVVSLTYIYGIGKTRALQTLKTAGVDPEKRTKDLTEEEVNQLRQLIEKQYRLEGDLRRDVLSFIKRLKDINCYRGTRHMKHLPVRGQRTKTNSRTVRGNVRRTTGSGKRTLTKT